MKHLALILALFTSTAMADNAIVMHTSTFTAIAYDCTDVGVNVWTEHYNDFQGMVIGTDCQLDITAPTMKRPPVFGQYNVIVSLTSYDVATQCAMIREDAHVPYRYTVEVWCRDNPFSERRN